MSGSVCGCRCCLVGNAQSVAARIGATFVPPKISGVCGVKGADISPYPNPTFVSAASPASPTAIPPAETPTAAPTRGPPDRIEGLPVITLAELPPEALETLALIASDGPFPFRQDGTTFQNRERILPSRSTGYYREFTVVTPGASTRGARRIVGGAEGELYYTDDHYDSFARIWLP